MTTTAALPMNVLPAPGANRPRLGRRSSKRIWRPCALTAMTARVWSQPEANSSAP